MSRPAEASVVALMNDLLEVMGQVFLLYAGEHNVLMTALKIIIKAGGWNVTA